MKKLLKLVKPKLPLIFLVLLLIPFYYILYKIYIPRVNAFGCFDDCNNFMGGYFLLQGKKIFSEFFFNHQPIAAYISFLIQKLTSPRNIFELVLRHRQFIILFAFLFNILLLIRFGLPAFLFAVIFETSKFYLFGDRFLSEGMIIYPLVYITGLILLKISSKKLFTIDYLLSAVFAWFVIFSREPYVPLAIFLFFMLLWSNFKKQKLSLILFIVLSILTIFSFNINEYFFNVVFVNYTQVLPTDIKAAMPGPRVIQDFFYPFYIFFYGKSNIFRQLLIGLDILFMFQFLLLLKNKKIKTAMFIFFVLGLTNLRVILPGTLFFEAFHMLVWFGLFVFITCFLIFQNSKKKTIFVLSTFAIFVILLSFLFSKSHFSKDKVNEHFEFLTNYGPVLQTGEAIKAMSRTGDTLFLDGSDDMIYWQAKINSPYKYSWFTSAMNLFPKYKDARIEMFKNNPPDFYKEFGSCPKEPIPGYSLPEFAKNQYVRFYSGGKPSCLFIRKDKLKNISDRELKEAKKFFYYLPKNEEN